MTVLAHLEPIDKPQGSRRGTARLVLSLGTTVGPSGAPVVIHDLSSTGLRLETAADLEAGDVFEVDLPRAGPVKATVVWRDGTLLGCEFAHSIPRAAISAALLRSEPAAKGEPGSSPRPQSSEIGQRERWARADRLAALSIVGFLALTVGGLAYISITWGFIALAVLAGLLALLVRWGLWVIDNTFPG